MAIQVTAKFNGLTVQVSADMTRSPGVSPDIGQLVWRDGTTQPSQAIGTLEFYNGDELVQSWTDCILDDPQVRRGQYIDVVYQIKDRRWRWEFPTLSGSYNIRDEDNEIIESTKKTPRELASLALDALGETGYDVSILPEDVELSPEVQWHYTSAAATLEKLCALYGCQVHLLAADTVQLQLMGEGTIPDDTGLMRPPDTGLIINPAPEHITAYAGDTLFESWLLLDAIGYELDGEIRPIEMISYRPDGKDGWRDLAEDNDPTDVRYKLEDANEDKETIEKKVSLAKRHIYRSFRVIGFPSSDLPPGYSDEFPRTENTSGKFKIYDKDLVEVSGEEYDTRVEAEDARRGLADPTHIIAPPGAVLFDPQQILPLESTRVSYGTDHINRKKKRQDPEVLGTFIPPDDEDGYGQKLKTNKNVWKRGMRINRKDGIITLSDVAYSYHMDAQAQDEEDKSRVIAPEMYLRIGYRVRKEPHGNVYHRAYTIPTGSGTGTANGVVNRSDIQEQRIATYPDPYSSFTVGSPQSNTASIDAILANAATERSKQYQNVQAPQRRMYTPLRSVDTNGKVQQVQYSCGVSRFGITTVSVGAQYDASQPPAAVKRQREVQLKSVEKEMQNFKEFKGAPAAEGDAI